MNPHLQRATILVEQSRYDMAEQELRRALVDDPNEPIAHALLGLCLANLGRFTEARSESEHAVHLAPDEPYVHYVRSFVLSERNMYKEAKDAVQEAIRLDPYDAQYFAQLSQLELALDQWEAAEKAANEGLQLDPEDVQCTNLRAMALVKQGKSIEAQSTLDAALRRAPEDAYAHANRGWAFLEQNEPQKAMEHFREALRLDPGMEWARLGIIEAMKARFFLYRWILNWFLWTAKLQQRARFGVIFGAYIGYVLLRRVANANPDIAPYIQPLLIIYMIFAVMTWLSSPLFNLVLRTSKFGRQALSPEEIRTSTWVGLCVLFALVMVSLYFVTGTPEFAVAALCFALIIPPLTSIYSCQEGWPRNTLTLITIGMLGVGTFVGSCLAVGTFVGGDSGKAIAGSGLVFFYPLVITSLALQFGMSFFVNARPRRDGSTGKLVWVIGGFLLALLAVIMIGFTAFAVWAASQPEFMEAAASVSTFAC